MKYKLNLGWATSLSCILFHQYFCCQFNIDSDNASLYIFLGLHLQKQFIQLNLWIFILWGVNYEFGLPYILIFTCLFLDETCLKWLGVQCLFQRLVLWETSQISHISSLHELCLFIYRIKALVDIKLLHIYSTWEL